MPRGSEAGGDPRAAQQLLLLCSGFSQGIKNNTLFTLILNFFQIICFKFFLDNLPIVAFKWTLQAKRLRWMNVHFLSPSSRQKIPQRDSELL